MRVVVQRVKNAQVRVESKVGLLRQILSVFDFAGPNSTKPKVKTFGRSRIVGEIDRGMLVFAGIGKKDTPQDADYLVRKIVEFRMFEDDNGKMNLSALETKAAFLVVSQFTLHGDCTKGRRPSFDKAADPQKGEELYNYFVDQLRKQKVHVETGQFRAMMDVHLINDGPVTFILDSKNENYC